MFIGTFCIECNTVEYEEGKQLELTVVIFFCKHCKPLDISNRGDNIVQLLRQKLYLFRVQLNPHYTFSPPLQ